MKNKKFNFFNSSNSVAGLALICSVLSAFVHASVYAQTDEEKVAVLITIINAHNTKVIHPDGVCLYPLVDFRGGNRLCFTTSQPSLPAAWNGQVSSISVSSSYHADIYSQTNYGGTSKLLESDATELGGLDNLVASVRLTPLDLDQDGVIYSSDQCPNTPTGEAVQGNGCALSQLDTDLDGVNDRDDQCSGTISGDKVDALGCSIELDSDGDGVKDKLDQCPGSTQSSNVQGCDATQIDTDNDGVSDAIDQCPGSSGTTNGAGCAPSQLDTDADGVNDALDQCPNTSSSLVGQDGCAVPKTDTDNDGIPDHFDNTPTQCVDVEAFNTTN